jgi:hypothetical protein
MAYEGTSTIAKTTVLIGAESVGHVVCQWKPSTRSVRPTRCSLAATASCPMPLGRQRRRSAMVCSRLCGNGHRPGADRVRPQPNNRSRTHCSIASSGDPFI